MRRSGKIDGVCHLCGMYGPLTYEHVPPSSAYNDCRILEADINRMLGGNLVQELENPHGTYNQRGAGNYTLCSQCNNSTGSWYGHAYVDFVKRTYHIPMLVRHSNEITINIECEPLKVLKQILVMFCSACGPGFAAKNPDLVRYLLNANSRSYPPSLSISLALFDRRNSRASRRSGITGRLDIDGGKNIFSEISFPPFNIVMCIDSEEPDKRLFNITSFKNYSYGERVAVTLRLYNLSVNSYFPGDYRAFDGLKRMSER